LLVPVDLLLRISKVRSRARRSGTSQLSRNDLPDTNGVLREGNTLPRI